ncbi:SRPBCC family protein [Nocardioides sp.]|uniref:SRPBCC family protein n=1 Tax=Nocardioides sp. TaxID=35761 RepID=UPI001A18420E|nr:SRPBCC family protein [Nocardioides sp.]MBJ7358162.1 SRPBCC family protein [Nocardioides sp.]
MTDQDPTTDARMGDVLRDDGRTGLRYVRRLAHPPEKVWRAITESEHLRHWFPADIVGERRAGAEVRMPFWPEMVEHSADEMEAAGVDLADPALPGLIRTWDPPRVFELIWGNDEGESDVLRYELEPEGDGTRLVFTTWLGEPGPSGHEGTAAGYHVCLDDLATLLDSGPSTSRMGDQSDLERRYAALLGA